jgi:DNA-binding transcriptional LysR family regulator
MLPSPTEPVRPHSSELVWTPLYTDRFWLIAPPGYADRSIKELLSALPFIRFDTKAWADRTIERELRRQHLHVRDEMVLDSQEVILRMVEKGLGVAIVPLSGEVSATLDLTCFPFGTPQLTRKVVLLERQDRGGGALAKALA